MKVKEASVILEGGNKTGRGLYIVRGGKRVERKGSKHRLR